MRIRRRAFTFIELLLALTLFSVGIISIIQIFPVNRKLLSQSAQTTQAVFLAQEAIEQLRSVPYSDLGDGTYAARAALSGQFAQYEREIVVNYIDASYQTSGSDTGLKRVTVTVYWTENAISRSYRLITFTRST